jgi:hypothetical protein
VRRARRHHIELARGLYSVPRELIGHGWTCALARPW